MKPPCRPTVTPQRRRRGQCAAPVTPVGAGDGVAFVGGGRASPRPGSLWKFSVLGYFGNQPACLHSLAQCQSAGLGVCSIGHSVAIT